MTAALRVAPITRDACAAWIRAHHAHLPNAPPGALLRVAVYDGDRLCCVAMLGRPAARALDDGRTAEVTRVASDGTTPNAASKAVGALVRCARALGYARLVTYTLPGEAGTTYRATGWRPDGVTRGGEWQRRSRARQTALACQKTRWTLTLDGGRS